MPDHVAAESGLCGACAWSRVVESRRGSRFLLCRRSEEDPSYPRYPKLPKEECRGFEGKERG